MTILDAIVLGAVQGLTEFLPVSSSGHLILAREIFGIGVESGIAFDAMLHFATSLAVVVYFRSDIWILVRTLGRLTTGTSEFKDRALLFAIIVATIPAVLFGYLLEDLIGMAFRDATLVALTLLLGSTIMFVAERWWRDTTFLLSPPSLRIAFVVGLFQSLALIPGMSRSGMAISGGMLMGLSREQSARFAFLIAVPLMLGAGAKKIAGMSLDGTGIEIMSLLAGSASAFFIGSIVIHYFLKFLRTNSLFPFIIYRVIIAFVALAVIYF